MSIEDEPIKNLEQAKRYFIAMGCSHFHLARENFQRRDEYYALHIKTKTETKWRQEVIEKQFVEFSSKETEKIGFFYSSLKDIITSDENNCNKYNLECMLTLTYSFLNDLPPDQIRHVLDTIVGNDGSKTHGGLIEKAYKIGLTKLGQQFIQSAKSLLEKAEANNITILWLRGNLVDIIKSLKVKEDDNYLNLLQEKDNIETFKYHLEGAKEGNVFSMRMLANLFTEGIGCKTDIMQAEYWLKQAIDSGSDLAKAERSN
jgi:hypothetical protein